MPGRTAKLMFDLASSTNWPEAYLYWQLPLSRALQYHHCHTFKNPYLWTIGLEDREPIESGAIDADRIAALLAADAGIVIPESPDKSVEIDPAE